MSFKSKILVDLFADLMNQVRAQLNIKYGFDNSQQPYYHYGTYQNFVNEFLEKDSYSQEKYPAIYLLQPFSENTDVQNIGILYEAEIQIYIVNHTEPNYSISDRYDEVFKPILYPIYEVLINELRNYRGFQFPLSNIKHTKQDLPHWGDGNANFANDYIDAIHITNLIIPVSKTNC